MYVLSHKPLSGPKLAEAASERTLSLAANIVLLVVAGIILAGVLALRFSQLIH